MAGQIPLVDYLVLGDQPHLVAQECDHCGARFFDRRNACASCGRREFAFLDGSRRAPISLCGRNAVQIHERARPVDLGELRRNLEPLGEVRSNEFALRFLLAPYEITVFPDGRAIIKGTQDVALARSLYARYIGA